MSDLENHQVVDTSALVAILYGQPDAPLFKTALENANGTLMAAPTFVELGLVLRGRLPNGKGFDLGQLLDKMRITRMPFTDAQADLALAAKYAYPVLNMGDTFAYALAKDLDLPLLFKGNEFTKTDLRSAV